MTDDLRRRMAKERDEHMYRGTKPSPDLDRRIKCAFCDARFKLVEHAAMHERSVHRKQLKRDFPHDR